MYLCLTHAKMSFAQVPLSCACLSRRISASPTVAPGAETLPLVLWLLLLLLPFIDGSAAVAAPFPSSLAKSCEVGRKQKFGKGGI